MSDFTIVAEKRDDLGKGASRRLRHAGLVPGIVYGTKKDPVSFQLKHTELEKRLQNEAFYSSILTLDLEGKEESVVLKDMQRHPAKNTIMHLDLLRIDKTHKLTMNIPLHYINEEACIGVKQDGGSINHHMNEIEVSCLAADLPEFIEIDMLEVALDQTIHLSDLKMPENVEINALLHGGDDSQPVASVHTRRAAVIEDDAPVAPEGETDAEDSAEGEDEES
ncbi:MAG: 50S ribosomal protein L25/general stress protein Ctc [Gammaproteobacteria bacterium]